MSYHQKIIMKIFKTLDDAISQLEEDYIGSIESHIKSIKSRGITRYNGTIYIVDKYGILN